MTGCSERRVQTTSLLQRSTHILLTHELINNFVIHASRPGLALQVQWSVDMAGKLMLWVFDKERS